METITRKFYEQIKLNQVPEKHAKILVCVSGGPDSVALLDLFLKCSHPFFFALGVAHVNHSLRGEDSEEDALFVADLAKNNNLPFYLHTILPEEWDTCPGSGVEEKARNVRRTFFDKIIKECSYNVIALGHNGDDLLETILFSLIRGISPDAMSKLLPPYDPRAHIVRPLLSFSKKEILCYLESKGVPYRLDVSNQENIFSRNKIRNQIIPLLQEINPKVGDSLLRFQKILSLEHSFLTEMTNESLQNITLSNRLGCITISKTKFSKLHRSMQHRIIREIRCTLLGNTTDFYFSQIISIHMGIIYTKDYCYKDKWMQIKCAGDFIVFCKGEVYPNG